jgi:cytochrome c553
MVAEATVNHGPNSIEKILAASNSISSAVADCVAECHQKNGNQHINVSMTKMTDLIQVIIRQLRIFSWAAFQAREERAEGTETAKNQRQ